MALSRRPSSSKMMTSFTQAFRQFNRYYMTRIETPSRGYLETEYSLQEATVIFEVGHSPGRTAKDIRLRAGFDQGYLSRLIARLTKAGLIAHNRSREDGRAQILRLTSAGRRAFRVLNERANAQAARLAGHLNPDELEELRNCLGAVQGLLDSTQPAEPISIRGQRMGDLGWVFYRQGMVYAREFGYGPLFESYVCEGLSPYMKNYNHKLDRLWIGEIGGRPVGSIAVHHVDDRPSWAKLRWFLVERHVRGRGLGSRLLKTVVDFCKGEYKGIFLWTVSDLDAARRLYERFGFSLVEEKEGCAWAPWAREQRWELRLFGRKPET